MFSGVLNGALASIAQLKPVLIALVYSSSLALDIPERI